MFSAMALGSSGSLKDWVEQPHPFLSSCFSRGVEEEIQEGDCVFPSCSSNRYVVMMVTLEVDHQGLACFLLLPCPCFCEISGKL